MGVDALAEHPSQQATQKKGSRCQPTRHCVAHPTELCARPL